MYPQIDLAFDAILRYQKKRKSVSHGFGGLRVQTRWSWVSKGEQFECDPRTVVCEMLKQWLREKSRDHDVDSEEVLCYRNFCTDYSFLIGYPKWPILDLCPSSFLIGFISNWIRF